LQLATKGQETKDPRYSYGWQRAEVLGALINGVFLLALCFSIFMEALERLFNVTEVSSPKVVVIVGSLGLASNVLGLFLFHDHGHSHGGGHSHGHSHTHGEAEDISAAAANEAEPLTKTSRPDRARSESVGSFSGHPAQTRAYVVRAAHDLGYDAPSSSTVDEENETGRLLGRQHSSSYGATHDEHNHSHDHDMETGDHKHDTKKAGMMSRLFKKGDESSNGHDGHSHSHSHSHGGDEDGSMNMRGVFLHVLGDALGNVGVIASGLFIAFSTVSWRFYSDPAISFLITIIIFHSALPLVKSASFILLQGVPSAVPLEEVRRALLQVKGVLSVHELHIWQLSEAKNVASVHVLIDVDEGNLTLYGTDADEAINKASTGDGSKTSITAKEHRYMDIAAQIRGKLHQFNIHSSTIQPEFVRGGIRGIAKVNGVDIDEAVTNETGKLVNKQGELIERQLSINGSACLISCGPADDFCAPSACCPPIASSETQSQASGSGSH
jgi:zinc transporter 1